MAISRDKKQSLVAELNDLLSSSKGIAFAQYSGISVTELQQLRKSAREAGVVIKVVKNRLVRIAMSQTDAFKTTNNDSLEGQLVYAFSDQDEVASAQVLNNFAKDNPLLQLAGGFSSDGLALNADEAKALATLPSKNQLIAEVVAQLLSPVHDTVNALSGNLHGLLDGIEAKATN